MHVLSLCIEHSEHHLPSEKQQCSREDPFVILLGSYLKAKDCQQVPIGKYMYTMCRT